MDTNNLELHQQIDRATNRLDGILATIDYITNDMIDSTETDTDPSDQFFINSYNHYHLSVNKAVPVLNTIRDDLADITAMLNDNYAAIVSNDKSKAV